MTFKLLKPIQAPLPIPLRSNLMITTFCFNLSCNASVPLMDEREATPLTLFALPHRSVSDTERGGLTLKWKQPAFSSAPACVQDMKRSFVWENIPVIPKSDWKSHLCAAGSGCSSWLESVSLHTFLTWNKPEGEGVAPTQHPGWKLGLKLRKLELQKRFAQRKQFPNYCHSLIGWGVFLLWPNWFI